jgi:hypothetical protein
MKLLLASLLGLMAITAPAQTQTYDLANDKIMNENYPFSVVQSAQAYTTKVGDYIFYAEPDFIDFCNASFGLDSKIPFIDFNQETAVIAFKSLSSSSSKLFVDNVVETEHFIKVFVKNTDAPKDVKKKTAVNQYIIVKVKKSNKEIKVIHV